MPRKYFMYSSSDEETYESFRWHYSHSCSHRKTHSPSSSRHRKITSRHSPQHSSTRWERNRSWSLSKTRRKRHKSWSHYHSKPRKRQRHSRSHSRDIHTNKGHCRLQTWSHSKARGSHRLLTSPHNASSHKGDTSSTTECLKYHIRRELQSIVCHTRGQTRERIEANHPIKQQNMCLLQSGHYILMKSLVW